MEKSVLNNFILMMIKYSFFYGLSCFLEYRLLHLLEKGSSGHAPNDIPFLLLLSILRMRGAVVWKSIAGCIGLTCRIIRILWIRWAARMVLPMPAGYGMAEVFGSILVKRQMDSMHLLICWEERFLAF